MEPALACLAALHSPSTGIIDSHAFMLALQGDAENAGAVMVFFSPVLGGRVVPGGVDIDVGGSDPMSLRCNLLVNSAGLHDHMRKAPVAKRQVVKSVGAVDEALKGATRLVEAEYEWPYQSHASMGPACAVADVRPDGVTIWNPSQKTHASSDGIAKLLGRPRETVRSIYTAGPGSYGRNDAGDAAADAVARSSTISRSAQRAVS